MSSSRKILAVTALVALIALAAAPFFGETIDWGSSLDVHIFWNLRMPRALLGFVCGAGLALAGVVLQALMRNPLATPFTLGVSSGASLGVVLALWFGLTATYARPFVGMGGAMLVIFLTWRLARIGGRMPVQSLLLAGVALTYLFSALILVVQVISTPHDAARILRWLIGSLETGLGYGPVLVVAGAVALAAALILPMGRAFNAMGGGTDAALGVGVEVHQVVRRGYLGASLMVGAIVAFVGPIGFIGLLIPHALRLLGLVDNRFLLPAAALAGGGFLALCDGVTNVAAAQRLPVGVVTHLLGGPFFLFLLLRERRLK
ncbi:MAG: FecCD family ABC transporter permease [Planctomycetota bacterium]|jgi:iron complex transport system permease protein